MSYLFAKNWKKKLIYASITHKTGIFPVHIITGMHRNAPEWASITGMDIKINNAPAMTMAGALSVTPVRTYLRTYVCPNDVRSLTQTLLIRIL